jgi:hypothetical protein
MPRVRGRGSAWHPHLLLLLLGWLMLLAGHSPWRVRAGVGARSGPWCATSLRVG